MNPGEFSIRNDRIVFVAMLLVLVGGLVAYQNMGRLEDPEFTIKEALIITPYPGASAEEVAKEVTNPIESALQQLGQLDRVESESSRGMSVVSAVIQDRYHKDAIPQVWDELRRKINDVQPQLPPSVRGRSMVIDDFGDVFGIFLAITGEGYSFAELRRYAEFLRRELLLAPNVKRSSFSPPSRKSSSSKSRGNGWRSSASTRSKSTATSRRGTSPPTAAACASAISTSRSIRKAVSARPRTCSIW